MSGAIIVKTLTATENEDGVRVDRLIGKYLDDAPKGFIYKMIRKKNIKVNGKRAKGDQRVREGDTVEIYLSDETLERFKKQKITGSGTIKIVYEDENILIADKPRGVLSQTGRSKKASINEDIIAYLLEKGEISENSLNTFRPSVVTRLDQNTSGLIMAGKNLNALRELSEMVRDRKIGKYYKCIVEGILTGEKTLEGYHICENGINKVRILDKPLPKASKVICRYKSLERLGANTLLEVELITGKKHQIRAQMAHIGHPVVGDVKYGAKSFGKGYALYCEKLLFPKMDGELSYLSEREFMADEPSDFKEMSGITLVAE